MRTVLTLSSKGQVTLPAAIRRRLGLRQGDRLEASLDEERGEITITHVAGIEDLSARISGYAKRREPVTDVDAYYQDHRAS